ncbi:MAG: hypothetical protein ACI85I_002630, partial [Arenicella sp.]
MKNPLYISLQIVLAVVIILVILGFKNNDSNLKNGNRPLSELVKELKLENQSFSILIEKKAYRLSMLVNGEIIKQYP